MDSSIIQCCQIPILQLLSLFLQELVEVRKQDLLGPFYRFTKQNQDPDWSCRGPVAVASCGRVQRLWGSLQLLLWRSSLGLSGAVGSLLLWAVAFQPDI